MSLFRKPKKIVRSRAPVGQEEDSGEDEVEVLQVNITNLKKEKKEKKKKKEKDKEKERGDKKTLLSFEEEGRYFKGSVIENLKGVSAK